MRRFIFAFLLLALSTAHSQSLQPVWVDHQYGYYSQGKALSEVLSDFAAELKLPLRISSAVNDTVNGDFPTMKAIDFLSMLARVYRLMWFYDGTVLHVYSTQEVQEESVAMSDEDVAELEKTLRELKVIGTHYYWQPIPNRGRAELSGPPRFIELVQELIAPVEEPPSLSDTLVPTVAKTVAEDEHVVKIFKLKYIYATADGKQKTTDIAQLLGRVMNVGYYVTESGESTVKEPSDAEKLLGSGLSPEYGAGADAEPAAGRPSADFKGSARAADSAYVIVDARLNMVIVRDKPRRIPAYAALIKQLDKPLDQIEIEVLILDINEDETKDLGIEWNYLSGDFSYTQGGISVTEMSAAQSHQFRIQLAALETQGRARISARPSVLTLDNHEAEFSNQETFYVKLGAQSAESQAVDLVPITYGAILKVKPHVIYQSDAAHEILLTLDIQDGRRSDSARKVDGVPSITNSKIKTQAMVSNGKSLLIGGYKVQHESTGLKSIPVLGYLPIIGLFFRSQNTVELDIRRYFLISPRLVESEVVFQSEADAQSILQRDDASYRARYPLQPPSQERPQPPRQPLSSPNGFKRTHTGPP